MDLPETHFKLLIRQGKLKRILTFSTKKKVPPVKCDDLLLAFEEWALAQLK